MSGRDRTSWRLALGVEQMAKEQERQKDQIEDLENQYGCSDFGDTVSLPWLGVSLDF